MTLKIEINLDNAAFADGGTDELIRATVDALEKLRGEWGNIGGTTATVRDINGNTVGEARVTE